VFSAITTKTAALTFSYLQNFDMR